jgi:tetratricopeptide (TPR) repeat protein
MAQRLLTNLLEVSASVANALQTAKHQENDPMLVKSTHHKRLITLLSLMLCLLLLAPTAEAGKKKKKKKKKAAPTATTEEASAPATGLSTPPAEVIEANHYLAAYDADAASKALSGLSADTSGWVGTANGRVLTLEKQYEAATKQLRQAADIDPANPAPVLFLGDAFAYAEKPAQASDAWAQTETRARALLAANENDADGLYFLGAAQQRQKRFAEALNTLERAKALRPGDPMIDLEIGVTHVYLQNWQQAFDRLSAAIDKNPGTAYAYYYRGLAAGKVNKKDILYNDLDRFVKMAPDAPEATNAKQLLGAF